MKLYALVIPALLLIPSTPTAQAGPALTQEPAPTEAKEPRVSHSSGLWNEEKHEVNGGWMIVHTPAMEQAPAKRELILGADFSTKKGPDLKLVLSPRKASDLSSKNVLKDGLVLGVLAKSSGESRFSIPVELDLGKYQSLAIHCEEYTVLWGTTTLESGEVVARGSKWTKKDRKIRGHWEIAKVGERHVLRFGEDFDTKNGPDLKVILTPHAISAASSDNALQGGRVVAALKDDEGSQSYDLGAGFKLADYRSVLIHCEQYSKLWGGAALR